MIRSMIPVLMLSAVCFCSCGESGKAPASDTATAAATVPAVPADPTTDLGKEGTNELLDVLAAYYNLKDALVASDGAKADEAASRLMSAADLFHAGMGAVPNKNEIQQQLREVTAGTEAITSTKAEAIEEKRVQFARVSNAMYSVAKLANLRNAGVYQQFCPMAMNDKGAYWLSPEADIRNPYYGKKMLTCGEVRDSL